MRSILCIAAMLCIVWASDLFAESTVGVYVCSSSAATSCTATKPKSALTGSDAVLFCATGSGSHGPVYKCTQSNPLPFWQMQLFSIVSTTEGWYAVSEIPTAPITITGSNPTSDMRKACDVSISPSKLKLLDVSADVSTRADSLLGWVCEFPDGYMPWTFYFTLNIKSVRAGIAYFLGFETKDSLIAKYGSSLWGTFTDSEEKFKQDFADSMRPTAVVDKSPTGADRPVFGLTSPGTIDPSRPFTRISFGKPCRSDVRIPGTNYYSVANNLDVNGKTIESGYAICKVSFTVQPSK
jgi:hypothetical protein